MPNVKLTMQETQFLLRLMQNELLSPNSKLSNEERSLAHRIAEQMRKSQYP